MNDQPHNGIKNKKIAQTILCFGDLLCIIILWIGFQDLRHFFIEFTNQAEVIKFSSRSGFFTIAALMLIVHIIIIIEHFYPDVIRKRLSVFNRSLVIVFIVFLFSGFYISSWMRSKVENAGYFYCRNASGVSALARTLVYTKNIDICEELAESDRKLRR